MNFLAMRIGPGKHLKGRVLMGGAVTPEEYDHFYEVRLFWLARACWLIFDFFLSFDMCSSFSTSKWPVSGREVSWMAC